MGAGDPILCLPHRGAPDHLHDRCHREPEQPHAQSCGSVRGHFPNDEAASKLLFLVLREVSKDWKMAAREWNAVKTQFAVMFGDRFIAN